MVDTQHFCLRWNNYQSSITSAFENLRDDEDFVDVTLACDGRSLKAHRVVLSACSPYFRELLKVSVVSFFPLRFPNDSFTNAQSTPCKHPVIVLQDVAFTDLHALVEFIYHGEVNVHQRSLSSFLKTAEILRVSGLTQQQAEDTHNVSDISLLSHFLRVCVCVFICIENRKCVFSLLETDSGVCVCFYVCTCKKIRRSLISKIVYFFCFFFTFLYIYTKQKNS